MSHVTETDTDYGNGSKTFRYEGALDFTAHVMNDQLEKAKDEDSLVVELEGFNGGSYSLEDLCGAIEVLERARDLIMKKLGKGQSLHMAVVEYLNEHGNPSPDGVLRQMYRTKLAQMVGVPDPAVSLREWHAANKPKR